MLLGCEDPGEPEFPRAPTNRVPVESPPLIAPEPRHVVRPNSRFEPLHVGGEVTAPVEISRVEPDCHGLSGVAIAELIVSENGAVEAGRVLRTVSPDAKPAILAAVRQWRFRPATFNGKPVAVYFTVTVRGCP